jgi:hypothetical protein
MKKIKKMNLNLKEQKILWTILNQAQDIGLQRTGELIKKYSTIQMDNDMLNDWIKQTSDEYDVINTLKLKLCGDLE